MGDVVEFRRTAGFGHRPTEPVRFEPVTVVPAEAAHGRGAPADPHRDLPYAPVPEPLWRHLAGHELRAARQRRRETLAQVAARAGISVQYLSEIERGRKEPSSEVLAAVTGALELRLVDLTSAVSLQLSAPRRIGAGPGRGSDPVALAA